MRKPRLRTVLTVAAFALAFSPASLALAHEHHGYPQVVHGDAFESRATASEAGRAKAGSGGYGYAQGDQDEGYRDDGYRDGGRLPGTLGRTATVSTTAMAKATATIGATMKMAASAICR